MNRTGLLAMQALMALVSLAVQAEESRNIRDNSFLLEEAYNQEPGVIQHIQAFQYMEDKSWNYTFTEEWPVPRETHQISVTVPVNHLHSDGTATGLGDVLLNYRYQLVLRNPIAVAPRLSLIFPTGDNTEGLGDDAFGFQANLPLSVEIGNSWVTHWNLGVTHIPSANGPSGVRKDTTGINYGASAIYLPSANVNFLLETVGSSNESIQGDGLVRREESFFINPGVRFAINHSSGLQIVPGIGVPIGLGPSEGEYGVFLYLSLEHPAF
jgi:hypothetical protein